MVILFRIAVFVAFRIVPTTCPPKYAHRCDSIFIFLYFHMTRKERRAELQNLKFLHTEKKMTMKEEVLADWSIKFQIEWYASTEAKDGSGDVILASGIKLDRYMVNPVLKRGHKRGEENNIGAVTELSYKEDNGVRGLYIKADIILNPEIESHKELIHGIRHNLINGFSIGFGDIVEKYDAERQVNVIESLTLYEISLVDIPDNPLTVRKMFDMIKNEKEVSLEDRETVDGEVVEEAADEEKAEEFVEEIKEEIQGDTNVENTETKEEVATEEVVQEETKSLQNSDEKWLMAENSLNELLRDAIKAKLWIADGTDQNVYVCCVYTNACVYNHYAFWDNGFDKYYRISYQTMWEELSLVWEPVEVESQTEWIDKSKASKEEMKQKMTVSIEIEVTDDTKMEEPEAPETDQNGCWPKRPMKSDGENPENIDWNVEVKALYMEETKTLKDRIVEVEKQVEAHKADIAEYEKSLKEMVDANVKLLDENKDLKEKVEIAKSFKMKSWFSFQWEQANPYHQGKLGNIVKMIQHA